MTELRRGAVVLFGERGEFTGKPRPGVVVQRESTLELAPTITLCGLTSHPAPTNPARISVLPAAINGLREPSWVMVDKIVSISRGRIRETIGLLSSADLDEVDVALRGWLDL